MISARHFSEVVGLISVKIGAKEVGVKSFLTTLYAPLVFLVIKVFRPCNCLLSITLGHHMYLPC